MEIPLSGPDITDLEIQAVLNVLKTPYLSLGPKLPEFEKKIAEYAGVKHAVVVSSGTAALHLIVRSLGLGKADEVITTPFSFIASANCLIYEKAKPVFVDIHPDTYNINVTKIEEKITDKTRAIIAVDVFGLMADWDALGRIAEKHDLFLIEDSCESLGAEYQARKAGSFGQAGCFAFYPNKQITTGEGGVIVTDDDQIARLAKSMRNQGRDENAGWLQHQRLGYNYRLSDINCALGIAQLKRIDEILAKRDKVAQMYNEKLKNMKDLKLPVDLPGSKRSWFVYVVHLTEKYSKMDRDSILDKLRKAGIGCSDYFSPIHLQPFYIELFGYKKGDFPVTEFTSERTIALPFFNNLSEKQIDYIVSALKKIL